MKHLLSKAAGLTLATLLLTACGEDGAAVLKQVEDAAATAREAGDRLDKGAALAEQVVNDPAGVLRDQTLSARFNRAPTAQANLFVLTDVATGCQYLATYAADGATVQSITPRMEGGRQRCLVPGGEARTPPDAASLVGKAIRGVGGSQAGEAAE